MSADIDDRFPLITADEARKHSDDTGRWVFPNLISTDSTILYGKSIAGKSYLVCDMLLSLLYPGRKFLGMRPEPSGKTWRPIILGSDPGSAAEYVGRLDQGAPTGGEPPDVAFRMMSTVRNPEHWRLLVDWIIEEGYNFVVLDNLNGVTGNCSDEEWTAFAWDAVGRLNYAGIPVVVMHHETQHQGVPSRGAPPMGASQNVQKPRVMVQVARTVEQAGFSSPIRVHVRSNSGKEPYEYVLRAEDGPNHTVVKQGYVEVRGSKKDQVVIYHDTTRANRSPETLDTRLKGAEWIVQHCQGLGPTAAARKYAEHTGRSYGGVIKDIGGNGRWRDILGRDREGNRWFVVEK